MPNTNSRALAIGPWGHRSPTPKDTARVILIGGPTLFNMIGRDDRQPVGDPVLVIGWPKKCMVDNLLFADGSARATQAAGRQAVDDAMTIALMNVGANVRLLSRGPTWQSDCWPVPGARVWGAADAWLPPYEGLGDGTRRPFRNAQRILD
ncbi:MAG: hypothetical protein AB7Q17_17390 [Phycisphaerae bacterium]